MSTPAATYLIMFCVLKIGTMMAEIPRTLANTNTTREGLLYFSTRTLIRWSPSTMLNIERVPNIIAYDHTRAPI